MAIQKILIEEFLSLGRLHPVLDVRSPGEYAHAHIPGATSFPLFTDEERKTVGTAYKQESREVAIKIGLDFFGPKMRRMVEEVEELMKERATVFGNEQSNERVGQQQKNKTVLVHCWRGGMRSAAVAWLLEMYGFNVYLLVGGYKRFRNYVLDTFSISFQFNILAGFTGSNKTGLLYELQKRGDTMVDLEAVAGHKGSAFGNIGLPAQVGQEMFENLLATALRKAIEKNEEIAVSTPIWLEDESQRIGQVNIPSALWKQMRCSPIFFLDLPFKERIQHICKEYGSLDPEKLQDAISRISKKLGNLNAKTAILALKEGKIAESFTILLKYYDKYYLKSLHNREGLNTLLHTIECKSIIPENADLLISCAQDQLQKH